MYSTYSGVSRTTYSVYEDVPRALQKDEYMVVTQQLLSFPRLLYRRKKDKRKCKKEFISNGKRRVVEAAQHGSDVGVRMDSLLPSLQSGVRASFL